MAICKLCQSNECDVDAHVIPRWAYSETLAHGPALVVPTAEDKYLSRSSKGEYDKTLVCTHCEESFSPYDDFGCRFFRDSDWQKSTFDRFESTLRSEYWIKHIEGNQFDSLQKFVLSLLWRISATDRPVFSGVNLGKREKELARLLLRESTTEQFPFRITRYFTPEHLPVLDPARMLFNPMSTKIHGFNCTRIPLPGFEIMISTDSRPNSLDLPDLRASAGSIPILGYCFTMSPDIHTIAQMIKRHPK